MHRIASIPARINIIGEHTDYAGGLSFAFAAPQRLTLKATAIPEGFEGESTIVSLWKEAKGWPAQLTVTSEIPIGAGMSSSAALCLAIVLCVDKDIEPLQACREAQRIEHAILKTECGLLDQMAMMFSKPNHGTFIDFSTNGTIQHHIPDSHVFKLIDSGIKLISLSDTIGSATPKMIKQVYEYFSVKYPNIEFGLHLHTHPQFWRDKVEISIDSGCVRIDGAIQGFGGCPMASDNMIGNMPTEKIISFCEEKGIDSGINPLKFESAYNYASDIFLNYR